MMTALEALEAIKKLLDSPEKWTQNKYARNAKGSRADAFSEKAVCWCWIGAAMKVTGDLGSVYTEAVGYMKLVLPPDCGITTWNDDPNTTYDAVMQATDHAIRLAKHTYPLEVLKYLAETDDATVPLAFRQ